MHGGTGRGSWSLRLRLRARQRSRPCQPPLPPRDPDLRRGQHRGAAAPRPPAVSADTAPPPFARASARSFVRPLSPLRLLGWAALPARETEDAARGRSRGTCGTARPKTRRWTPPPRPRPRRIAVWPKAPRALPTPACAHPQTPPAAPAAMPPRVAVCSAPTESKTCDVRRAAHPEPQKDKKDPYLCASNYPEPK